MKDLSELHKIGLGLLQNWRSRYSLEEYPEKILLNIFYRKYTTDFMWNDIENCFQNGVQKKWCDFDSGFEYLNNLYSSVASAKTHNQLPILLRENPNRIVGNLSYSSYKDRISKAKRGSSIILRKLNLHIYFIYSSIKQF
ncbi:MAG: hypothetical protein ACOYOT_08980 [Bacteroidales bacterium]